jgi:hypothetical protein
MGMPISTYTVLNALANKDRNSYEAEVARRALSSFRLFAFIIHDPNAPPEPKHKFYM